MNSYCIFQHLAEVGELGEKTGAGACLPLNNTTVRQRKYTLRRLQPSFY